MSIKETIKKAIKKSEPEVIVETAPEVVLETTTVPPNPVLAMGFAQAAERRARELAGT